MHQEEVEVYLTSIQSGGDYEPEVSLRITAYLEASSNIEKNTIWFDCDPIGTNYTRSSLSVTFEDWSTVVEIRDFLAHHFNELEMSRRSKTFEIKDGYQSITPYDSPPKTTEGLDEIKINLDGDRINFNQSGTVLPYIYTFEEQTQSGQDNRNAQKILNFFDEIISQHPTYSMDSEGADYPEINQLLNPHYVENLLTRIVTPESELYNDYQKAVREFEDEEYTDCIRDIGKAAEAVIDILVSELYDEDEVNDRTGSRLKKVNNTERGIPAFISKTISPLWWLRNKSSHANTYEPTKDDAHFALICFQVALEKLLNDQTAD